MDKYSVIAEGFDDATHDDPILGHSENKGGVPELLCDHINRVAELAVQFGAAFDSAEQAFAAGMLHDLGKYADQFQRRVRGENERGRNALLRT